jgi:hypothetical protein
MPMLKDSENGTHHTMGPDSLASERSVPQYPTPRLSPRLLHKHAVHHLWWSLVLFGFGAGAYLLDFTTLAKATTAMGFVPLLMCLFFQTLAASFEYPGDRDPLQSH